VQWLLARGLPLLVWHEETDWDSLHALTGAFPELPVILETQARKVLYHSRPLFALLGIRPNLYVETSNLVGPDFLGNAVRHYGPERLIFGSFLPQNDPLAPIGMLVDSGIAEADMGLVAGGNLRRLLERRTPEAARMSDTPPSGEESP
jgi:predicted TIM-barrel fold metal-dependent hydrolase